jgi:hypothetical protein
LECGKAIPVIEEKQAIDPLSDPSYGPIKNSHEYTKVCFRNCVWTQWPRKKEQQAKIK